MTIAVYILIFVLQAGVIAYLVWRGKKDKTGKPQVASAAVVSNYETLRTEAFTVTPAHLRLGIPDSEVFVYGVIMDWNMGDTVVTLVTFITGAANMYLSSGGGVTAGGKNPSVGETAAELVNMAQSYLGRAIPVVEVSVPAKDMVRFYFLTNHHKHAVQDVISHFDDRSSPWLPLFEKANEVIVEMRAVLN